MSERQYRRFLVFRIEQYYPAGGLGDCDGDFDTLEEAKAFAAEEAAKYDNCDYIFDRIEGKEIDL